MPKKSFSIDADNQSFPPSISGIQNGIVAYAMNQREWKVQDARVELAATSNVTKESNSKWSARYDLKAEYKITALERVIDNGAYRVAPPRRGGDSRRSIGVTSWLTVSSVFFRLKKRSAICKNNMCPNTHFV